MIVKPWPYLKSVIFENSAHLIRYDKLLLKNKSWLSYGDNDYKILSGKLPDTWFAELSLTGSKEGLARLFGQEPYKSWGTMKREKSDTGLELLQMNVVEGASWTLFPYLGLLDNKSFYKSNLILLNVIF